jgi:hypothetical protein
LGNGQDSAALLGPGRFIYGLHRTKDTVPKLARGTNGKWYNARRYVIQCNNTENLTEMFSN